MSSYLNGEIPANQLQIYTWMDADLYELTNLIKEMKPDTSVKGTVFKYAVVYPCPKSSGYLMSKIGTTIVGYRGPQDFLNLKSTRFEIGDYLSVAITPPPERPPRYNQNIEQPSGKADAN